ncbi:sensor domain-containing diguanylate cyclase [Paenibacillus macerans]|uniref:Diguanylate cyclase domain protein n=1 Tax=Paenibacillus macerans TaxID=44252 RepID=A0A090ZTJ6_PAEMA|nr:sensor domain-containing diguanylate cyclase [Paenibacillus macerans]KFN07466.1 diguanylate cyclase domain protein [Paenibacillus macerans]MCY7557548.1 sensor domain-containing diguanylate cyclase [Paenibacillus macerans]MEC0138451.1 sensor domain-containing diguanylate cyclase [Paenibacillus macerans]MEC0154082.1 sensor domain-containing diguanylate cyclase [Paenibacillus macerans]SUA85848.1 diguanylate cyclase [Paenibacillus macerans]
MNSKKRTYPKIRLAVLFSLIVGLAVIITTFISAASSYKAERSILYNRTLEMNYSTSLQMSRTLGTLFKSMRLGLHTVSIHLFDADEASQSADIQAKLDFFKNSNDYFNSVFWADAKGVVRSIASPNYNLAGTKLVSTPALEALATRKSTLSKPYTGTSGRLIILMTEPVFDRNGVYHGFIGGTIYLEENNILDSIFSENLADKTGSYYYIVDSSGQLIFHPDTSRRGENVSENAVVQAVKNGESGRKPVINTKKVSFLAGYATVPEVGWGIIMQTPISMVEKQQEEQICKMLLIMALPFILIMAATIYMAHKVTEPIVWLAQFARSSVRNARKLPPIRTSHWIWEADLLTKTVLNSLKTMQDQNERLTDSTRKDPLTGLQNRRALNEVLALFDFAKHSFSMLILDIDRFKQINDTYGHQTGDEVLKFVSDLVQSAVRQKDFCFRFGGEEFIVILPDTPLAVAFQTAERIRGQLEGTVSPAGRPVTVSIGVAEFPVQSDDLGELFRLADKALYQAKGDGRNRTVAADESWAEECVSIKDR